MRYTFLLMFVLGVGAGIGLTAVLLPDLDTGMESALQTVSIPPAEGDEDLVRSLRGALAQTEIALENERTRAADLEDQLFEANQRLEEAQQAEQAQLTARAERAERRQANVENTIRQRIQRRIATYSRAINLRPDQEQALESLSEQFTANLIARREALQNGTEPPPELDFDALVENILDPQQTQELQTFRDEVRQGRNETIATSQLNRIAPGLDLTDQQKDLVFEIYYQNAGRRNDPATVEVINEQMRQTLSPEQYAAWLELEASRRNRQNNNR